MNVRTVINGTNNNECNKRNDECTVSRAEVDWKMFTFRLGSHVSLSFFLFFFVRVVREPSHFHLKFSVRKPNYSNFQTFENRGLTVCKSVGLNPYSTFSNINLNMSPFKRYVAKSKNA